MSSKLKILAVDDTITYRSILKEAVSRIKNTELIGVASNGVTGLEKIKQLDPDVVLLDVEMPQMNGLRALELIRRDHPKVGVVMISGVNQKSADATIKALELGALDFIKKPNKPTIDENIEFIRSHLSPILTIFATNRNKMNQPPSPPPARLKSMRETPLPKNYDLIIIGSSTGGPNALMKIIPELPADFPVPIAIVQHMPENFTASLSKTLDLKSKLKIKEAENLEELRPGHVYLAPGGKHLDIKPPNSNYPSYRAKITDGLPINNCKPSIDRTLESLQKGSGNILIIILTGMGIDGSRGLEKLKRNGHAVCITQSEASCVVYGMPRIIDEMGLSDFSLDLDSIREKLLSFSGMEIDAYGE